MRGVLCGRVLIPTNKLASQSRNEGTAAALNLILNQIETADEPNPSAPKKLKRCRWVALLVALLIGAASLWFLLPNPALLPKAVILPSDYSIKAQPLPFPDQWIPPTWGWLWKLRYALLGKPITVTIDTEMILLRRPGYPGLRQVVEDIPYLAASNGLRLWILPEKKLNELTERLFVDSYDEREYLALTQWPDERLPSRAGRVQ